MATNDVQRGGTERTVRARLSAADRRRIAAGLAKGLGPAAIARTIGRSTSTVSREIARAGGPDHYRAGAAQRGADNRARRYTPPVPTYTTEKSTAAELEAEFADVVTRTGLPRGAARVLARLHLSHDGRLTARELTETLGLSAASVSSAVRYLDGQGLITRHRHGRRDIYTVDADVWRRTWQASLRTNGQWAAVCRRGADLLGTDTPQGARLDTAWRFFARLQRDLHLAGRAAGFTAGEFVRGRDHDFR